MKISSVRQAEELDLAREDQMQLVGIDDPAAAFLGLAAALNGVIRRPGIVNCQFLAKGDPAASLDEEFVAEMFLILAERLRIVVHQFAVRLARVIHVAERTLRLDHLPVAEFHAVPRRVSRIRDEPAGDLAEDLAAAEWFFGVETLAIRGGSDPDRGLFRGHRAIRVRRLAQGGDIMLSRVEKSLWQARINTDSSSDLRPVT